ncbi:hypothetical protein [Sphingopyxis sp. BSNA05]|uniref:hypothetical protein n=1 Tax=Sphingopyxis sp. BSNA05 TaxID=1236614 RepID=UPI001C2810B3|nr:hypothetical protein [Sphingopyxis sp. BSNA05]
MLLNQRVEMAGISSLSRLAPISGNVLKRCPVALKIAFARAGAAGGVGGSPTLRAGCWRQ